MKERGGRASGLVDGWIQEGNSGTLDLATKDILGSLHEAVRNGDRSNVGTPSFWKRYEETCAEDAVVLIWNHARVRASE